MDHFREDVDAATRNLKDAKVKVKTELDKNGDLVHDLDKLTKDNKLKLKTDLDKSSLERSIGEAKLAAKAADVTIKVKTRRGGLGGLMDGASEGAANLFAGLKMPDVLPNIGGLGGIPSILLIVGALSLLAPALALVSSALVSLPALITAVAAPIGVLAIGLGGIKKALEDSGILTDTKGKNGKDKIGLGTFLKQIQESVSNVFEKGLTPLFKQVFDAFSGNIPILTRGLPFIAQGIVDLATGVTRAITNVPNMQMLDRLTNSIGSMLTNLTPGLTAFTTGMIRLTTDVGDHLPGLGTVLSGFADRFTNWVAKVDKPKQSWFGGDIPGSSELDQAVTNMKPVLESVVNFVGKLTDAGLKLAANPQMADNIKKVVDGLTNVVTNLLPQLASVFDKIAAIMGKISPDGKPPVPPGVKTQPAPGKNFAGLPPGVAPVVPVPKEDIPKTGFGLIEQWLKNTFTRPQTDHPVIVQQGGGAGGQQPQKPQQVQSPKVDMNGVAQAIQGGAGAIAAAANAAFKALSDAATVAVSQAVQAVQQLPGAIAQALAGVGPAGAAAGQALGTGMAGGIAASAPAAIAAAHALAQGVTAAAHTTLEINSPSKVFHRIGMSVGEGFQDGITASFGDFNGIPWPLPGKNKVKLNRFPDKWAPWDESEAQPPGNFNPGIKIDTSTTTSTGPEWLEDGKNASKGFGRGLTSGAPFVAEAAQGVAGSATDALRAALGIRSPSVVFHGLGQNTAEGFQNGLEGGFQGVLDSAKSLSQKVSDAMKGGTQGIGPQFKDDISKQLSALDLERKQLKVQYDAATDKGEKKQLETQMKQLGAAGDQLRLQKDQLGYSDKYGEGIDKTDDKMQKMLGGSVNKMVDIGKNFAMSNVNQFESDIGISGQGAIPTLANLGLNWGTQMLNGMVTNAFGGGQGKTEIHVNSVDEALAAKQTTDNRRALTHHAGR